MKTDQLRNLLLEGAQITTRDGRPYRLPGKPEEITLLRSIVELLEKLLAKPGPKLPVLEPPKVVVKPAEVILEPVKKWKFELKKDFQGRTTEIIATAME